MLTDIEIAQKSEMLPISDIMYQLNKYNYEPYGKYKAKLKYDVVNGKIVGLF